MKPVQPAKIANTMAATADQIWGAEITNNTWLIAWLGSITYMLQIYYDFSGYSDMAIGLGRVFGFHFDENFNLPYISQSISEFWRRWHISLSSWFRDYVYIPLGGNRRHVYRNLGIVFLLTGIWHGASWHFIIWGIWNGTFILIERCAGLNKIELQNDNKIKKVCMKIYTLFIINLGWVLFRSENMGDAITFMKVMFGFIKPKYPGYTLFWYLDRWTLMILGIAVLFASRGPVEIKEKLRAMTNEKVFVIGKYIWLIGVLYFSMLRIVSGTYNPFIYFQF